MANNDDLIFTANELAAQLECEPQEARDLLNTLAQVGGAIEVGSVAKVGHKGKRARAFRIDIETGLANLRQVLESLTPPVRADGEYQASNPAAPAQGDEA